MLMLASVLFGGINQTYFFCYFQDKEEQEALANEVNGEFMKSIGLLCHDYVVLCAVLFFLCAIDDLGWSSSCIYTSWA